MNNWSDDGPKGFLIPHINKTFGELNSRINDLAVRFSQQQKYDGSSRQASILNRETSKAIEDFEENGGNQAKRFIRRKTKENLEE